MSDQDLSHYIPGRLDDHGKFLFWDMDIAFVALTGMLSGVAAGYTFLGFIVGISMAFWYKKLKTGQHPGVGAHLLYWVVGFPEPDEFAPSYLREFNG